MVDFERLQATPAETWGVLVLIAVKLTTLSIYAVAMTYCCLKNLPPCHRWLSVPVSSVGRWLACFKQYRSNSFVDNPFEHKVLLLATTARVRRARKMCCVVVHLGASLCFGLLFFLGYYDLDIWLTDQTRAKWELHQSGTVQLVWCFAACTYCWLFPDWITSRTLSLFHGVIIMRICWQMATCESLYQLFALEHATDAIRFCAALAVGTPTLTLGLNLQLSVMKLCRFALLYGALEIEEQGFVYSVWGDVKSYTMHELFLLATVWGVSVLFDGWNYAAVRANLQAKQSSTGEQCVKSILVVLCDAVVTVDESLHFNDEALEIARFLLRQPSCNSYQGSSFLDMVEEGDRDRIRQQIISSSMGHGTTLSLSSRLVDGNGNLLNVQMYCTCFIDVDDRCAYTIGILELKDVSCVAQRQDSVAPAVIDDTILNGARGSGALHAAHTERDSFESCESMGSPIKHLVRDEEEMEFWIDLGDETMRVVDASHSTRTMTGPETCFGVSFLDWLRHYEAPDVVTRISQAFQRFIEDPQAGSAQADLGCFHLRPPHATKAGLEYFVRVIMDMSQLLEAGNDEGPSHVCLRPVSVCVKKVSKKKKKLVIPVATPLQAVATAEAAVSSKSTKSSSGKASVGTAFAARKQTALSLPL
eukprot:TRINITY_DN5949_c0_g3_i3.p1 TRINITY_DN5949_c0_g3~~TRINITY_DN5949_c0_g3_i3.p1  ORF type:complete len:645 (-),score=106.59 TRINITY_DN5949_c0_g3_i3:328-2262(-)